MRDFCLTSQKFFRCRGGHECESGGCRNPAPSRHGCQARLRRRRPAALGQADGRRRYLGFRGFCGRALHHVAVVGDVWSALVDLQAGTFRVAVRDAWLGWSDEQRHLRLLLVASNARPLVSGRIPNLASRVLGLSFRVRASSVRDPRLQ